MRSEGFKLPQELDADNLRPCLLCCTKGARKGANCPRCLGYGWLDDYGDSLPLPIKITQEVEK